MVFIMVFALGACAPQNDEPQNGDEGNGDVIVDPDPNQQEEQVEVTIYYVSNEYIMTGSGDMIIPTTRTVTVGEESLDEAIISELQKMPEDEEITTMLEDMRFLSVETLDNVVYTNIASDSLGNTGGSLMEASILSQLVWTLTEVEGIDKVQILVDGSKRETLMGHISIDEPIGRQ